MYTWPHANVCEAIGYFCRSFCLSVGKLLKQRIWTESAYSVHTHTKQQHMYIHTCTLQWFHSIALTVHVKWSQFDLATKQGKSLGVIVRCLTLLHPTEDKKIIYSELIHLGCVKHLYLTNSCPVFVVFQKAWDTGGSPLIIAETPHTNIFNFGLCTVTIPCTDKH